MLNSNPRPNMMFVCILCTPRSIGRGYFLTEEWAIRTYFYNVYAHAIYNFKQFRFGNYIQVLKLFAANFIQQIHMVLFEHTYMFKHAHAAWSTRFH